LPAATTPARDGVNGGGVSWKIAYWNVEDFGCNAKTCPVSTTVGVASRHLRAVLLAHTVTPSVIFVEQMHVKCQAAQQRLAYGFLGAMHAVAAEIADATGAPFTAAFMAGAAKNRFLGPFLPAPAPKGSYLQRKRAAVSCVAALYLAGITDPKVLANAFIAGLVGPLLKAIAPNEKQFGIGSK
jgi:hypothetical protein